MMERVTWVRCEGQVAPPHYAPFAPWPPLSGRFQGRDGMGWEAPLAHPLFTLPRPFCLPSSVVSRPSVSEQVDVEPPIDVSRTRS